MTTQIKSKQRVADHGEVFTRQEEVNAMLDLVKNETLRIESRFLEPACGNGNFLIEILRRKLEVVERQYAKSQREYEFYLVVAIGAIYGIELQQDNVQACRERLCKFVEQSYRLLFPETVNDEVIEVIRFILSLNIVQGNALKMCYVDDNNQDLPHKMLHFSEWSTVSFPRKWCLKRHDFEYQHLVFDGAEPYQSFQEYFACYFLEIQNAKPID
ncbi:restriction endonuclease subunit M [Nicoletella semolina]|nr:DNA methyltransferase [Nicoletella semolina]MDH2923838.1 restriction endonuclease subunit M [Nicoletella semolina]